MSQRRRLRVLCLIARLSVGGAPVQASLLSGRLNANRFEVLLASGEVPPGEASMEFALREYGANRVSVPCLGPRIDPVKDIRALGAVSRLVRRFRPDIIHSHTAKAGFLGRLAALSISPRPAIVHTYHGHVLEGYFGAAASAVFLNLERRAARHTDILTAPSQATVDDLVRLELAPRHKFRVVPLGLDLERFVTAADDGSSVRKELGIDSSVVLCLFVGRLVGIKRLDVLLRATALARAHGNAIHLAIAGSGELETEIASLVQELGLREDVSLLGVRRDIERLASAADVAVLTSDNEGTPVALIEAAAAGRPAVATDVGGVSDVVQPGTGILVPRGDHEAFAAALGQLAADPDLRETLGSRAQQHVLANFTAEDLVRRTERIYEEIVASDSR